MIRMRGLRRSTRGRGRRQTCGLVHPGRHFQSLCLLSNVVSVYRPVILMLSSDVLLEVFLEALEVFMEVFLVEVFAAVVEVLQIFLGTHWIR